MTNDQLTVRVQQLETKVGRIPGTNADGGENSIGALMSTWGSEFNSLEDRIHELESTMERQQQVLREVQLKTTDERFQNVWEAIAQMQEQLKTSTATPVKENSPGQASARSAHPRPSTSVASSFPESDAGPQTQITVATATNGGSMSTEHYAQQLLLRLELGDEINPHLVRQLQNRLAQLESKSDTLQGTDLSHRSLKAGRINSQAMLLEGTLLKTAEHTQPPIRGDDQNSSTPEERSSAKKRRLADASLLPIESPRRTGREHKQPARREGMLSWREAKNQGYRTGRGTAPWTPPKGKQ